MVVMMVMVSMRRILLQLIHFRFLPIEFNQSFQNGFNRLQNLNQEWPRTVFWLMIERSILLVIVTGKIDLREIFEVRLEKGQML
jgi:hypothetical protein